MNAKRLILLGASFLCLGTIGWAKDDLPTTQKFARYEPMLKQSPFAVASAGATATTPDFAKDLYIANAAHSPEGDFVTLASTTDKNVKEYLSTKETIHGFSISNIQWSDQVGETKVTITKDGQFATLTFNEALLSQAIQNPVPQIQQPQIQQPQLPNHNVRMPGNPQGQVQRPMAVPQIPTPPPHTRPVIRRKATPQRPTPRPLPQQLQQQQQQTLSEDDESDLETP